MDVGESEDAGQDGLLGGTTEMHARWRARDWAATPLGPVSSWPITLRVLAPVVLASGVPTALLWGESHVVLYNDAYIPLMGAQHPRALGAPLFETAPETRDTFEPLLRRVLAGESLNLDDVPTVFRREALAASATTNAYSFSFAPVRAADDPSRIIGVHCVVAETPSERALASAHAARRESEARASAIVAHLPHAGAFVVDQELRYLVAGGEALAESGYTADRFLGRTIDEVLPAELAAEYGARYRRALAGEPFVTEHDAEGRAWITRGVPLRNLAGQVDAALAVSYDVTDLRAAERALRASEELQSFLLQLSDTLRQVNDPMLVQQVAMNVLGEHMGVNRALYFELMPDADTLIAGPGYVSGVQPMPALARLSDFSDTLAAHYRRGETLIATDVLTDFGVEWGHAFAAIETRATIGVPLLKEGRLVAIMGVHQATPRAWTPFEVALMEAVAERTWAALERARAETALRESEARYRTLVDNVRDYAIFLLDARGNVTEWTTSAQRLKGYTADEALGLPLAHFYTQEDLELGVPEMELEQAAREGRAEREGWRVRKDGSRFWVDEIATAVRAPDGTLIGFTKISRDLTERRRVEAAASRERADQDRDVRRRELAAAEEAERGRLARELHDQLGQQLTAFTLGIAEIERLASPLMPRGSALRFRLESLRTLAQRMMSDARYFALELRPPELDDLGLESALETYVREWSERYGIRADTTVTGVTDAAIPDDVMNTLYRITQEALTNIAKHASAKDVSIILEKPDGEVRLIVEDDGRGFDATAVTVGRKQRRLGLISMRERAALVGGTVLIESSADHGTTVYVRIPLGAPVDPVAPDLNEENSAR